MNSMLSTKPSNSSMPLKKVWKRNIKKTGIRGLCEVNIPFELVAFCPSLTLSCKNSDSMAQRVVHLRALTALEVSPAQVAFLVVFLAVSMDPRKDLAWRKPTKKLSFKSLDPFHTSRLKNITTFNLQCNQYKYIVCFCLSIGGRGRFFF